VVDEVLADSRAGIAVVRPPGHHAEQVGRGRGIILFLMLSRNPFITVGDPDPHVFGPPGSESGSISQR
jgi:hypothetical protein